MEISFKAKKNGASFGGGRDCGVAGFFVIVNQMAISNKINGNATYCRHAPVAFSRSRRFHRKHKTQFN